MGEVYRARDTRLDRLVAIKVLPAGATSAQALGRFEREAKAIAALNHPGICAIYDVGTSPVPFLVMELLEGETLHQRLGRGPMHAVALVDTGLALADALAAAHAKGILHRDLKPANIVLTPRGPKVLDFGLARATESAAAVEHGATAFETLAAQSPLTDLWVQPIDGSPSRQLTQFPADGQQIWGVAWSADGRRLAVGTCLAHEQHRPVSRAARSHPVSPTEPGSRIRQRLTELPS